MRDFLPEEKSRRDYLLSRIRDVYRAHGFQEIETPALEDINRLTSGQGGDNEKLAFRVMKRGAELNEALADLAAEDVDRLADLGLRYDLTVPLTRYYATNQAKLPRVFKAMQAGPVWRAERPQKGRYRQFMQCDIDIIGEPGELAEVELLNASLDALEAIGLGAATIRVNHRELLVELLNRLGVQPEQHASAMITIDKLDKIHADGVVVELAEKFGSQVSQAAQVWLTALGENPEVPAELDRLFAAIAAKHGPHKLRFDPTLVRGMGYYTGPIFEIEHPESGSSIGGGGRYDGMVGRWLGSDTPAVGISIGFERAVELVELDVQSGKSLVLILNSESAECLASAISVQAEAISAGYRVRLELKPKKLNLLLDSMSQNGFGFFAQIGEEPVKFGDLQLRSIEN
jgi:histidyl-tRNA synthetase